MYISIAASFVTILLATCSSEAHVEEETQTVERLALLSGGSLLGTTGGLLGSVTGLVSSALTSIGLLNVGILGGIGSCSNGVVPLLPATQSPSCLAYADPTSILSIGLLGKPITCKPILKLQVLTDLANKALPWTCSLLSSDYYADLDVTTFFYKITNGASVAVAVDITQVLLSWGGCCNVQSVSDKVALFGFDGTCGVVGALLGSALHFVTNTVTGLLEEVVSITVKGKVAIGNVKVVLKGNGFYKTYNVIGPVCGACGGSVVNSNLLNLNIAMNSVLNLASANLDVSLLSQVAGILLGVTATGTPHCCSLGSNTCTRVDSCNADYYECCGMCGGS